MIYKFLICRNVYFFNYCGQVCDIVYNIPLLQKLVKG